MVTENENEVVERESIDTSGIESRLDTLIEQADRSVHPALYTDFADYTVTEGLLLLLFVSVFASWLIKIVKGGFSWLF